MTMDYQGKKVLVLDGYGRQIPTVLQQLHDEGCVITTLNCSKYDCGYTSKYAAGKLVHPEARHDQKKLKEVLDREILSGKYDYVFPMLEPATEVLLANREAYDKHTTIMCAPFESFIQACDKQKTMTACMKNGIPCPVTKTDDESLDEFVRKVGFPIVIKPRKGSGSMGLHILKNREELDKILKTTKLENNVLQEFVPQTGRQYLAYLIYDRQHHCRAQIIAEKVRWYPLDGGTASFMQSVDRPDITKSSVALLNSINWVGVAHIDLIEDPRNGIVKVMEINGRMPASIKIFAPAKVPFVRQLLDCYSGRPVEDYRANEKEGYRIRYLQTDFLWLLKSPNRFKSKPSWFNFTRAQDMIFSWKDPMPFFSYSISHIRTYKEDMAKRSR